MHLANFMGNLVLVTIQISMHTSLEYTFSVIICIFIKILRERRSRLSGFIHSLMEVHFGNTYL
jgi:hypothetical protein